MTQTALDLGAEPPRYRRPPEPILRAAAIEDNYRWTATRSWGAGPVAHWNLLNPSLASGKIDDPTMWRMICFSHGWGFGSIIVTNVYPFISPNTAALRAWRARWNNDNDWPPPHGGVWPFDKSAQGAWIHNQDVVREIVKRDDVTHVAAWGNGADPEDLEIFLREVTWDWDTIGADRFTAAADDGREIPVTWMCMGKTASGAPVHPLARGAHRVPDDKQLEVWRKP